MSRTLTLRAGAMAALLAAGPELAAQTTDPEQEVRAFRRQVVEASRARDRAALERMLAPDFVFIHANGITESRAQYIETTGAGLQTAQRMVVDSAADLEVRVYDGRTALLTARSVWTPPGGGDELRLRTLHVYVKRADGWQSVFAQSTRLPSRPSAFAVSEETQQAIVGRYELAGGRVFTVRRDGAKLLGQTTGRAEGELIAQSETEFVWFHPEHMVDSRFTFTREADGAVSAVYRNDGKEVWRAKKTR